MLLCFLVFCLPTMNGIVLAYFTTQLQRDVGITIAQYSLLSGGQQRQVRVARSVLPASCGVLTNHIDPGSALLPLYLSIVEAYLRCCSVLALSRVLHFICAEKTDKHEVITSRTCMHIVK